MFYVLVINSSDGQMGSEDVTEKATFVPDFQEQALAYETFFEATEDEPWIRGVSTERWDWFDQYHRPGDTPEAIYFDVTLESSPRSKPAEEVVDKLEASTAPPWDSAWPNSSQAAVDHRRPFR